MPSLLRVSTQHISDLEAGQLQSLINKLLHLEALKHSIPLSSSQGTDATRITVADGGQDAAIKWSNGVASTDFFLRRHTMYQVKAESMSKAKCLDEMLTAPLPTKSKKKAKEKAGSKRGKATKPKGKAIAKPAIENCLNGGGAHVMFCSQSAEGTRLSERINGMREGLRLAGRKDWKIAPVDFFDANKIRDWVNLYPSAINWVLEQLGRGTWHNAHTWDQWSGYEDVSSGRFVTDAPIGSRIADLRNLLSSSVRVSRLVGLSGLGKTRLTFEALRPPLPHTGDSRQSALSDSVLYINASSNEDAVVDMANQLRVEKWPVLLVVDDCRPDLHVRLSQIARHAESRFRLLTLDYDPAPKMPDVDVVSIGPVSDEVIKEILSDTKPPLSKEDLEYLIRFAQGYPKLAVLLRDQSRKTGDRVSMLGDDQLLRRMVWGRDSENTEAWNALKVCSAFTSLGFADEGEEQAEKAAALAGISLQAFRSHISRFMERGIVQQRGRFVQVLPPPLALRLAAEWWKAFSPAQAKRAIEQISADMVETMCDQLRLLDELAHARSLAADLCGAKGPFYSAEVLSTETGSRCFRSLVDLNPEAALATLEHAVSEADVERLKGGRRNLVVALEHIVFHAHLFRRAADLLREFALAETESWSNNSTGQFLQLFHIYLSGTEASLAERLSYLTELTKAEESSLELTIQALDNALETHHFTRMGGAEEQGTKKLKEYRPKTTEEIREYLGNSLSLLVKIANAHEPQAFRARGAISRHFRGLLGQGMLAEVKQAIETILPSVQGYWPEALEQVGKFLQFEGPGSDKQYVAAVEELQRYLRPSALKDRLKLYVSEMPWGLFAFDEKTFDTPNDPRLLAATQLADEVLGIQTSQQVDEVLPGLLTGEQRNIFGFGKRLGERHPEPAAFLAKATELVRKTREPNTSLIGAILSGLAMRNRPLVDQTLDQYAGDPLLAQFVPYLTTAAGVIDTDIARIEHLLQSGVLNSSAIRYFSFGRAVDRIKPITLKSLLRTAIKFGHGGVWDALDVAFMHVHGRPDRRKDFEDIFETIIMTPDLLAHSPEGGNGMDVHHFETIAVDLIEHSPRGGEIAQHLAEEFVKLSSQKRFPHHLDHLSHAVLNPMATKYPEKVWPIFGRTLGSASGLAKLHLGNLLVSGTLGSKQDNKQPLALFPLPILLDWANQTPSGAAFLLRYLPPLAKGADGSIEWHPYIRAVIDRFGDKRSLGELSANIWSFGWAGSVIPYYEQYLVPLEKLKTSSRPAVKSWANAQIASLKDQIKRERGREEEHQLGRY